MISTHTRGRTRLGTTAAAMQPSLPRARRGGRRACPRSGEDGMRSREVAQLPRRLHHSPSCSALAGAACNLPAQAGAARLRPAAVAARRRPAAARLRQGVRPAAGAAPRRQGCNGPPRAGYQLLGEPRPKRRRLPLPCRRRAGGQQGTGVTSMQEDAPQHCRPLCRQPSGPRRLPRLRRGALAALAQRRGQTGAPVPPPSSPSKTQLG